MKYFLSAKWPSVTRLLCGRNAAAIKKFRLEETINQNRNFMNQKLMINVFCVWACVFPLRAASDAAGSDAGGAASAAPAAMSSRDLEALRQRIAEQQEQIKRLEQTIDAQQKLLERALANLQTRNPGA